MLVKCARSVVKKAKLSWPVLLILKVHSKVCTDSCVAIWAMQYQKCMPTL